MIRKLPLLSGVSGAGVERYREERENQNQNQNQSLCWALTPLRSFTSSKIIFRLLKKYNLGKTKSEVKKWTSVQNWAFYCRILTYFIFYFEDPSSQKCSYLCRCFCYLLDIKQLLTDLDFNPPNHRHITHLSRFFRTFYLTGPQYMKQFGHPVIISTDNECNSDVVWFLDINPYDGAALWWNKAFSQWSQRSELQWKVKGRG